MSLLILFVNLLMVFIRPWIDAIGGQATTIIMAVIYILSNLSFLVMTQWGKKFRARTAQKYLTVTQQRA
jgi:hypothetical protein